MGSKYTVQSKIDYTSVFVDTKGIFRWTIIKTPQANLNTVIESDIGLKEILQEDKMPLIIDLTQIKSVDLNCQSYFTNNFHHYFFAGVILVKSAVSILLANLILREISNVDIPILMVDNEQKGFEYLSSFIA